MGEDDEQGVGEPLADLRHRVAVGMAALAILERIWTSYDISYVEGCVIGWDMA